VSVPPEKVRTAVYVVAVYVKEIVLPDGPGPDHVPANSGAAGGLAAGLEQLHTSAKAGIRMTRAQNLDRFIYASVCIYDYFYHKYEYI
jgi:hypothetical protein